MYEGGSQGTSCWRQFYDWWRQVPLHTKSLFWCINILYLASSLLIYLPYELAMFPYFVYEYQIWRMITGPIVFFDFFTLCLGIFLYMPLASKKERELGTVRYTLLFFINSILVSSILVSMAMLFSTVFGLQSLRGMYMLGTLPYYMIELVSDCHRDPELPRNFLGCIQLRAKYVPWVILVIFSFISQGLISFNMIAGITVGYLHCKGWLRKLYIRGSTAQQLEASILFYAPAKASNFAKVQDEDSFDDDHVDYLQRLDYPTHNTDESEMINNIENMESDSFEDSGERFFPEPRDDRGIEMAPRT